MVAGPVSSVERDHSRATCWGSVASSRTPMNSSSLVAGSAISQSSQQTPPMPSSCREVAARNCVAAPGPWPIGEGRPALRRGIHAIESQPTTRCEPADETARWAWSSPAKRNLVLSLATDGTHEWSGDEFRNFGLQGSCWLPVNITGACVADVPGSPECPVAWACSLGHGSPYGCSVHVRPAWMAGASSRGRRTLRSPLRYTGGSMGNRQGAGRPHWAVVHDARGRQRRATVPSRARSPQTRRSPSTHGRFPIRADAALVMAPATTSRRGRKRRGSERAGLQVPDDRRKANPLPSALPETCHGCTLRPVRCRRYGSPGRRLHPPPTGGTRRWDRDPGTP